MTSSMGVVKTRLLNPLCILISACACLAMAGPAAAEVIPEGTGEPLYTNSVQNTQWFRVTKPTGIGSYRLKVSYYANNALVSEQTVPNAQNGVIWANWSGVATLQHGGQYGICIQGEYTFPNDSLWISDGPNSCSAGTMLGRRSYTTIDRSKPSIAVTAAGGAASTKSASIPVSIAFSDDVAGPYPSTWTCIAAGSDPCGQFDYNQKCSVPAGGGKSTTFSCDLDASQLPDGPVTVCARSADASVPDNPSGADQSRPATQANLSDAGCDTVTLDRSVPAPPDNGGETPADPTPADPTPVDPTPVDPTPTTPAPAIKGLQVGSLTVAVPKRVKLGKVRQLVLTAHAQQAGRLTLALTRGKKVYSRLSVGLSAGQTRQRLRLPRRLKAGTYTVKIAFKESGAGWSATGTTKISARK
jgi:hypothetical protein